MNDAPQPITSVGRSTWRYFIQHGIFTGIILAAAAACVIGGILAQMPALAAMAIFVLIVGYAIAQSKAQTAFMAQFAAANGYAFSPKASMDGLDGAFFRIGRDQRRYDLVSGSYGNYPIELFLYQYAIGQGKYMQVYVYTVFRLRFDTAMPDLVLEQKNYPVERSILTSAARQKEFVSLEGDFNKYFTLSIPKGYEVEALEIFTPEIMATLVEKCASLDLEIVGTDLFIYAPGAAGKEATLNALYGIAQYFADQLGPVLARMKPGLMAMGEVAQGEGR
jgi:hypothetical protein